MAQLSVFLLGPFQAAVDGQLLAAFSSHKAQALLAILAAEPERAHTRESFAGLLWPDHPNSIALTYFRNALSCLRRVIGDAKTRPPFLLVTRETIQLNPQAEVWIDLRAFEEAVGADREDLPGQISKLVSAAGLYRGPFLDGFVSDGLLFEEWITIVRARVNRLLRNGLHQLADAYLQCDEHAQSIQAAQQLLDLDPWDEQAHRLVMRGLAQSGQRARALAQYEACKWILKTELGVEPSIETLNLARNIQMGALELASKESARDEIAFDRDRLHLPVPLTSFIGRKAELDAIRRLLGWSDQGKALQEKARLLTLTGEGGCGKTRLALACVSRLVEDGCYPRGVGWVDFSSVMDPKLVTAAVAAACGLRSAGHTQLLQLLVNHIDDQEFLLVMNDCEHLIEPVARLMENLLLACPGIQILATSREPMGVDGENIWRVPGLSLPQGENKGRGEIDALRKYDSIHLFEDRARAVLPGWRLEENAQAVVDICTRLDGIPLAIELAAAQLRVMTAEQILEHLNDAFTLLIGGSRSALPRHKTLRACIDWSYGLLSPAESALLRQLSVFQGGWSLEAVEFIGKSDPLPGIPPDEILDVLTRLVDRSWVVVRKQGKASRYRLLDTIRQYAYAKLELNGEVPAACRRHLACCLDFALHAEAQLRGPEQVAWHGLVETELDNLRSALRWAVEKDPIAGLRIATGLYWFWTRKMYWVVEGVQWLERGLLADDEQKRSESLIPSEHDSIRGWALNVATWLISTILGHDYGWIQYRTSQAKQELLAQLVAYTAEALRLFRRMGKAGRCGYAFALGWRPENRSDQKREYLEESIRIFRDEGHKFYLAESLALLGNLLKDEYQQYAEAKTFFKQHLDIRKEIGDVIGVAYAYLLLGCVDFETGFYLMAKRHLERALTMYQSIGSVEEIVWQTANFLVHNAIQLDDLTCARKYAEMLLNLARATGEDWQYSLGKLTMGWLLSKDHPDLAARMIADGVKRARSAGIFYGKVVALEWQANLDLMNAQPERAASLLAVSMRYRAAAKYPFAAYEKKRQEQLRKAIMDRLDAVVFDQAWVKGQIMSLEQALALVWGENGANGGLINGTHYGAGAV